MRASKGVNLLFFFSGLGSVLGSQILTKSGYIMNNMAYLHEDDADKRLNTLLTPVIVLENEKICGRRLLLGRLGFMFLNFWSLGML